MLTEVTGVRVGRTLSSDAVAFALTLTFSEEETGSKSTPNQHQPQLRRTRVSDPHPYSDFFCSSHALAYFQETYAAW
jgi:hypothetical protein